jgi:mycoredoxin
MLGSWMSSLEEGTLPPAGSGYARQGRFPTADALDPSYLDREGAFVVPDVTIYWRPMCGYCEQLKQELRRRDVPFASVDIWHDRDKAEIVRSATGGDEIVPTVEVAGRFLVNPSPDEVVAARDGGA